MREPQLPFGLWPLILLLGFAFMAFGVCAALVALTRQAPELISPAALAASADGRLFCFVEFSRILSLDSDGRPLGSWRVSTGAGLARLRTTADYLEVATVRTRKRLLYTSEGELIESREDLAAYSDFPESYRASLPGGAFAQLRGEALVRLDPDGVQTVIVSSRPWPLAGWPLPSSLLTLALVPGTLGVVLACALRRQLPGAGRLTRRCS